MPKQFMSLLSDCCSGSVAGVLRVGTKASCGRFRATAMPMGTELPETEGCKGCKANGYDQFWTAGTLWNLLVDFSRSDTFGEGASIFTSVVSVDEDMVLEVAEAVTEDEDTLPSPWRWWWCCCCW